MIIIWIYYISNMKVIFLDIDGVLNHEQFYRDKDSNIIKILDLSLHLDPNSVRLLNEICEVTGAKVVLSSTWRRHQSLDKAREIFKNKGFKGEIIDLTPDLTLNNPDFLRGNEILKWIKINEKMLGANYKNYKDYVILDDKTFMLYWQKDNFFKIDPRVGLTPENVEEIINFLS